MTFGWHDVVGNIGVALIVLTYAGLQWNWLDAKSVLYSFCNALGAALIMVSLMITFNLSSMVIEVFWLAISLWGLQRALRQRALRRGSAPNGR